MVFNPFMDWKVRALFIGIVQERCKQLLCGWWVVGWKSDWMKRPTRHSILYQDKSSSIVTNWSCRHPSILRYWLHHQLMCPAFNLVLDWSSPVSRLFVRWVLRSFIIWSLSIMLYHPFSHTMSYAPIFTHHWTPDFPWWTFPLFQLIHLFSQPTSFPDQPTNHGVPNFILLKQSKLGATLPANSW